MLSQMPDVSFVACQSGAVDSGLLPCTNADCLSVLCEANGVGLCIFQCNQCDNKVALCFLRQVLVFCYYIFQKSLIDGEVISALLKGNAENLFLFLHRRHIGRVDFYDIIVALFLCFQNFQCFLCIAGRNDTIGNLSFNQLCGCCITNIAERNPVPEGGHSVCPSCSCVSQCQRGIIQTLDIIHEAGFFQRITHGCADCRRGRAYMLEGGCRRHTQCFLDFLYQLPAVECVQKVDVAGSAAEDFDGQIAAVLHKDFCRLLVWITAIFQFKFFHLPKTPFFPVLPTMLTHFC